MKSDYLYEEGVVKFDYKCESTTPLIFSPSEHKIFEVYEKLHQMQLIGLDHNTNISFGNISFKNDDSKKVIVTSTDIGRLESVKVEDFCEIIKVDLKKNQVLYNGPKIPSSESMTHYFCYEANEEVNFVYHIHHVGIWNYYIENKLPSISCRTPYGTPMMAEEVFCLLKKHNFKGGLGISMAGHHGGMLYCSNDIENGLNIINRDLKNV